LEERSDASQKNNAVFPQSSFSLLEDYMRYRLFALFVVVMLIMASVGPIAAQDKKFGEAPMLAEQVKAGKLPPVEERLPENPRIIDMPGSTIGTYGGDFRDPFVGDSYWASQMIFYIVWHGLVNWTQDYSNWQPNVAEKVDVSADATEYTFTLRKGLKWSDGKPFTSDDVIFYIEDILGNEELNSGKFPSGFLMPGKAAPVVKKIDDITFSIKFDVPYGMFLLNMCTYDGWAMITAPKHYLQQFHKKYNPDGIEALIKETEGATDWVTLFQKKSAVGPGADPAVISRDTAYPTMFPWIYTQPMGTGTQFIAERNPYYYWVDKEGNQLPYIDRIVGTSYQDEQTMLVDVFAGKFDTMANTTDAQKPLFFENEKTSGLKVYPNSSEGGGTSSVLFNQTHKDLGKLFSEKDFRIGMSYAIDRKEVIEIAYFGQGEPRQISPTKDSPLYNEQLTTQYVEYDVAKANEHLDKVLPKKDADGMRLNPATSEKLNIVFTVQKQDYGLRFVDVAELLKKYYKAVGVEITVDVVENNDVITTRAKDNSLQATIFTGEGGVGITSIMDPRYFVPVHGQSYWGNGWALWYIEPTNPNAVEPPQAVKDHIAQFEKVKQAPTGEERIELMKKVLQTAADNFWVIGISSANEGYRPLSAKLGNVPEIWVHGWNPGGPSIALPEQWFYKAE
jgi:peptide/nickel transport system substrate-binding protein